MKQWNTVFKWFVGALFMSYLPIGSVEFFLYHATQLFKKNLISEVFLAGVIYIVSNKLQFFCNIGVFLKRRRSFLHGNFEVFCGISRETGNLLFIDKTWKIHEKKTSFRKDDFCCKRPAICHRTTRCDTGEENLRFQVFLKKFVMHDLEKTPLEILEEVRKNLT